MLEIIQSGGWMMVPIIIASVLALAITVERFWTLRPGKIAPPNLLSQVWGWMKNKQLDSAKIRSLKDSSPLGNVLAAGLINSRHGRQIMKESIEEVASHEIHEMERYLNALGTVAAVAPLMGLLGTVIGMIKVFAEIMAQGTGQANLLAGGISEALITTAAGLVVAIPALICHRILQRRVDEIVVYMEQEALKLVDVLHGEREVADAPENAG
ncbi:MULTISPECIES: MotA/TolQ/ExbB proton channel family protein [Thalassolituus]|jgi:biopolymer transport protein ExbB|uniref:MotA/TolQ/ExbB proton channel family protein n=1 Tax=Thalassolituus TaxID=187492 RepID=UPI0007CFDEF8|nr:MULTISPECIES: MotA/TolQ/ExbB proton channel family protein [Thalassolituus]KZY95731.1 biopolymer transporter ExbB [Oleibacter sp. HI0075]MAX86506.1 MotA/TolQ/ExbB proton channel family protein [Oceanospirillaceae bacterium]MEC9255296.1 MotA/TolQ/ExbB proton channel family protein [Pseudomonadota bacterium]HCG79540.1 MotA/TolQ/ExbB proton channel family protein [Oceanospirillales bacterium]MEC9410182.1 MotA/TolQ/ExbB proton channel family protein [Pseudomonadota bacterium]|tara:strand:- start:11659 stop:12294 length:636 start_codon:yes stop_codon:yes gene_type:complete